VSNLIGAIGRVARGPPRCTLLTEIAWGVTGTDPFGASRTVLFASTTGRHVLADTGLVKRVAVVYAGALVLPAATGTGFILRSSSDVRIAIGLATNRCHAFDNFGQTEPLHRRHSRHDEAPISADSCHKPPEQGRSVIGGERSPSHRTPRTSVTPTSFDRLGSRVGNARAAN
jgi:hypothetical protein